MSGPIRFLFRVIALACALQSAGLLKDATMLMLGKAVEAHQHGGVRLGEWNRKLLGDRH
jgi:hypothetical protein